MADRRYTLEPLGKHHNREAFSCGVEELDHYLHHHASQDARRRVATVWILYDTEDGSVAGYYTLSAFTVEPTSLSPQIARKLPRYPALPAMLIGRLAVALSHRGQGLGEILLVDALHRALQLSRQLGSIAVIVEAKDDNAAAFYEHYDFLRYENDPKHLYLPMQTIARMFADES